jgi:hypothetical protein
MTSVGTLLRSARQEQQREIVEIAEELCITPRYLRAIEEDDLDSLPGVFFYKSFVRQYAAFLGVESQRIQEAVDAASQTDPRAGSAAPLPHADVRIRENLRSWLIESIDLAHDALAPRSTSVRQPDPLVQDFNRYFSDRRIGMSVAGLAVVLLACSGFYAWWSRAPEPPVPISDALPTTPAPAAPLVESAAALPAGDLDGTVNHAELNLSATETTWLSITVDGKLIFSGILQPSQTKTITGIEGAKMKVGNAGGLEIRWKGKTIGPIGPRGQVRTVVFKTDDVEILRPVPESSEL